MEKYHICQKYSTSLLYYVFLNLWFCKKLKIKKFWKLYYGENK